MAFPSWREEGLGELVPPEPHYEWQAASALTPQTAFPMSPEVHDVPMWTQPHNAQIHSLSSITRSYVHIQTHTLTPRDEHKLNTNNKINHNANQRSWHDIPSGEGRGRRKRIRTRGRPIPQPNARSPWSNQLSGACKRPRLLPLLDPYIIPGVKSPPSPFAH